MNCFDKFVYFSKIYRHEWILVNGIDMVVSRYVIPIGIPCVDGLSTGPPGFRVSQVPRLWHHWSLSQSVPDLPTGADLHCPSSCLPTCMALLGFILPLVAIHGSCFNIFGYGISAMVAGQWSLPSRNRRPQ